MANHHAYAHLQRAEKGEEHGTRQPKSSLTPDRSKIAVLETPFRPPVAAHAALLASAGSSENLARTVLQLQRTYGNGYVQRLLKLGSMQAKLTVSSPDDIYEREADSVAETVTRTVSARPQRQADVEDEEPLQGKLAVQRQADEEEEELQAKPLVQRQAVEEEEPLQGKLAVQRQADEDDEEEEEVQTKSLLQRQADEEEEELQAKSAVKERQAGPKVGSDVEYSINAARGGGQPISDDVRQPMEEAFGSDFGGVRIHTGSGADSLNHSLQARAFTTGEDIFFRNGEYSPTSSAGKQLLAHELTHTIQQTGGRALRTRISRTPRTTASRAGAKQPPPVPSRANRPPAPSTSSTGSTSVGGMDRVTYDKAIEQFNKWKRPRLRGGLSESKRKQEAEKYLIETVGRLPAYAPLLINSVLEAYRETFGEELNVTGLDAIKKLQQTGGGIAPVGAGKSLAEFAKEGKGERREGSLEAFGQGTETVSSLGEQGNSAQDIVDSKTDVAAFIKGKATAPGESDKSKATGAYLSGGGDIWAGVGGGIASIFGFAKAAGMSFKKQGFEKVNTIIDAIGSGVGALVKGAKGAIEVAQEAAKVDLKGGPLDIAKAVLGPIPDAIMTLVGIIKIAYAVASNKSKDALEAGWQTVKSGVAAITGTVGMVFKLISTLAGAVPIVGAVAAGVSAILDSIEAGYLFVKRVMKFLSLRKLAKKIAQKIAEIRARPAVTSTEKADNKSKAERLKYIGTTNSKKRRNAGREVAKQGAGILGALTKLGGAVVSLIGDLATVTGIGAVVGGVLKAFGAAASIFGAVVSGIGAAITFVPKIFNAIRQFGRNQAAKGGRTGKFFSALGFNAEKSSDKKHEERKKAVVGIFDDAGKLKTDFADPSGKDRAGVLAEIPKFKDLDFELEATGVNKDELYKLNSETNDDKRTEQQVKLLYDALKKR